MTADLLTTPLRGLSREEAARRLTRIGPNAVHRKRATVLRVLLRQFRSPILLLLIVTAGVSFVVGDSTNSLIIGVILVASIGLGFANEFRAERAADALHDSVRHHVTVLRDGRALPVDVVDLVPGDLVRLSVGTVVPADMTVREERDLRCDEAILTGESEPARKSTPRDGHDPADSILQMGTIVHTGSGLGEVTATGTRTAFGRIAEGLGESAPVTEFQRGLSRFSVLLLEVALVLTTLIFVANLLLQRPLIDSLLFSLAIAVGITPQLLPAVVSTSLAAGTRALARRKVLVKRLVCIEDLGDLDLLVTDKTGTLTQGRIAFDRAVPVEGDTDDTELIHLGLMASEVGFTDAALDVTGLNSLDTALWEHAGSGAFASARQAPPLAVLPFDHERRMTSALVQHPGGESVLVVKGAPEDVMARCSDLAAGSLTTLDSLYRDGERVLAVATRPVPGATTLTRDAERDLRLIGFLVFADPIKADAAASVDRLARLGVAVKIATGDSAVVTEKLCADLGIVSEGTLSGTDLDRLDDTELAAAARTTTIFARVSPEQKARIIRMLRTKGHSVAFLGDGVNDALALHQADIGVSVDSAADVAKDAADVILLDKDLGVLSDGVLEGRRIFANTMKYVLMGTSSNFGNMFSASIASVALSFLPMLPGQILLNNLLYDTGQMAIPTDRVDPEQLERPSHWDISFIRRFMLVFGSISSIFDFATFALMLVVFNAAAGEFRAGWFIESIATQTLIVFAIRTRRVPFFRSRPSLALVGSALGVVAVGIWLPLSPLSGLLGFTPIPASFFLALVGTIVVYLVIVEFAKKAFFSHAARTPGRARPRRDRTGHQVRRRSARFTEKTS
ncbi:magnesium-translocating P-type ATPase [Herbiconiux sp.]|uniref:magnesium-translocating P-type ATPase n=1 Tax=Herbiconiux sp. TaxID=1871186 RepID=UPI0025BD3A95|nr:magnesium-translocating P-type ATPase [Herbiconiux sp.]